MPQAEWDGWAARHGQLFALTTDADARMLAEWAGLFARAGYAPAELTEATEWLATNAPPRFRTEHLPALLERLRDQRQRRPPPAEDRWGTCADCHGSGLVSVPNPKAVALGRWGTLAVACGCPAGRRFREGRRAFLTLADYQAARPGWRDELAAHQALLRAEAEAGPPGPLAAAFDAATAKLRRRLEELRRGPLALPGPPGEEIPW